METALIIGGCALFIFLMGKIFSFPAKVIYKIIINIILGTLMLFLVNYIGGYFNYKIAFNTVNSIIIGLLGVPGVIAIMVLKYLNI
ncbi:MAG: pro-sigmaK processing inhibitor BofA family protein [Clostridia bacterium]